MCPIFSYSVPNTLGTSTIPTLTYQVQNTFGTSTIPTMTYPLPNIVSTSTGYYRNGGPVPNRNVNPPKPTETPTNQVPIQLSALATGLRDMYASAEHADLTISCKGSTWNVHKVILCAQSEYFRKGLSGGRFREGQDGVVALEDEDPVDVDVMLHYFYHFGYLDYLKKKEATGDPVAWDVKMFFMADRYFIDSLKDVAARCFRFHADATWNTPAFFNAVRDVYDHFPAQNAADNLLKQAIIQIVKRHQGLLVDHSVCSDFLDILSTRPDLGKDVAVALASKTPQKYHKCPGCGFAFSVEAGVSQVSCPNMHCNHSCLFGGSWDSVENQQ